MYSRHMHFSCTCPRYMYIPRVLAFLSHATSSRYKQCGAFSSSTNSIAMKAELFCVDKHDTLRLHHLLGDISLHASHHHYVYHIIIAWIRNKRDNLRLHHTSQKGQGLYRYIFVFKHTHTHTRHTHTHAKAHTRTHTASMHTYINMYTRHMYTSCTYPIYSAFWFRVYKVSG